LWKVVNAKVRGREIRPVEKPPAEEQSDLMDALQSVGQHANGRRRFEEVFVDAGIPHKAEHCEAMAGLIRESSEIVATPGDAAAKDVALIAAAQRVEHYEIAAYGTARALAHELGLATPSRSSTRPSTRSPRPTGC
jgi:ferritin-like metal-binding protein YciE